MSTWKQTRIGDVCQVIPGYAFKSKDWVDTGIPVVKIKNIKPDCTVDLSDVDCVPNSVITQKLEKFRLQDQDILVAMTGATAGKVGKLRTSIPAYLNQRVAKIKPVSLDPGYLWAVVSSEGYQQRFFKLADGAAQPNMSGRQIEDVEFLLPPPVVQRRIASILSAYDDLIENNTRRIAILEEMARRIYEEWFVRFRFPGHEQVRMVESESGLIPEGWIICHLGDLAKIQWGDTSLTKAAYVDKGFTAYSASGPDGFLDHFQRNGLGIVLSAIGAQCGKTWLAKDQWGCIKNTICLWSVEDLIVSNEYLFILTSGEKYWPRRGAAQPFISLGDARNCPALRPTRNVMALFTQHVTPLFGMASVLATKNRNLRTTRDLLLPKLISGELDVSTLPEPEALAA